MLDHEDTGIKLTLHIPKEKQPSKATTSKVEEFLADNREYLEEESKDSEVPDDYDSEEEGGESSSDSEVSDATSSSMSSMLVSPGGPESSQKKQQFPMEEIDRIIREAKDQKRKLQGMAEEEPESSMSESGFDQRYLQK